MKTSLLQQAMSPQNLDASWRRLRKEHTPWDVQTDRDQLANNLVHHLLVCRDEVLAGEYRPEPLRQFTMRKPDGKDRVLSAQYLKDKLLQRAILAVLEPRAEKLFHPDSYAYRPARGVAQAISKVRERISTGLDWLVDADIQSFFDSIPHKPLEKVLDNFIDDRDTMRLVKRWLAIGAHQTSLLGKRKGISQGAILSPIFCNLYLHQFDQALSNANVSFVRYADDFLLFTSSQDNALRARAFAESALEKMQLTIHPEKTQCVRSSTAIRFLGETLPSPSR